MVHKKNYQTNPVGQVYTISSVSLLSKHHGDLFVSVSFCDNFAPPLQCVTLFGALLNLLTLPGRGGSISHNAPRHQAYSSTQNHETVNPRDTRKTMDANYTGGIPALSTRPASLPAGFPRIAPAPTSRVVVAIWRAVGQRWQVGLTNTIR